ncbi:hypothetical protein [Nitrobacter sp. JJSN]|uniref:hypothetical protein n=1 Tax=Nitrobacter sp. JJSN TaxID=3453033 RepID=UPI003F771ABF
MTDPRANNAAKTRGRPFKPGNPGKPKGAKHKTTLFLENMTDEDRAAFVSMIIRQAARGCRASQKLIADRIEPTRKARVRFTLRPIATVDDVVAAFADIAAAVASGVLTLDEAAAASTIIEKTREGVITRDLAHKIAALEEKYQS